MTTGVGGLLNFTDEKGEMSQIMVPRLNALSLLADGQMHFVSQVASYVPVPRVSVTGWLAGTPMQFVLKRS